MSFQKDVRRSLNEGVAGTPASANPFVSQVRKAGVAGISPGIFAHISPDGATFLPGPGDNSFFVIRTNTGKITGYMAESQMEFTLGENVTGVYTGDWYARSTTTAVFGQRVFINDTTGAIATGGADDAVPGHTKSSWVVSYVAAPGTAGSTLIISKY